MSNREPGNETDDDDLDSGTSEVVATAKRRAAQVATWLNKWLRITKLRKKHLADRGQLAASQITLLTKDGFNADTGKYTRPSEEYIDRIARAFAPSDDALYRKIGHEGRVAAEYITEVPSADAGEGCTIHLKSPLTPSQCDRLTVAVEYLVSAFTGEDAAEILPDVVTTIARAQTDDVDTYSVLDSGMMPLFTPGDVVMIRPGQVAKPGNTVLALAKSRVRAGRYGEDTSGPYLELSEGDIQRQFRLMGTVVGYYRAVN